MSERGVDLALIIDEKRVSGVNSAFAWLKKK